MAKQRVTHVKPTGAGTMSLDKARKLTLSRPNDPQVWKNYGGMLTNSGKHIEALEALGRAAVLSPQDPFVHSSMAYAHHKLGDIAAASECLDEALALDGEHVQGLVLAGILQQEAGKREKALIYLERAEQVAPNDTAVLRNKAITLSTLSRYDESLVLLERLLKDNPQSFALWNDTANIRRDVGDFDGLDDYFQTAIRLAGNDPVPYSNRLTYIHYDPAWTREAIFEVCLEWQRRYAPADPPPRPVPADLDPRRRLRLGLFSDGFRNHPVGTMIVRALENLSKQDVELFLYPTHGDEDNLTARLRQVADHWKPIKHLKGEAFAQLVRDDRIDILVDLAGHNSGTRSGTIALQPAPLQVKWVGGLINTTGIEAMDYLISDHVETPPGEEEDALFVENLIRLPDDYIVFSPPPHTPATGPLPAITNGYITLGCFNNPTKINQVTLREWARLMHELPDSRLLLKGKPYTSESFRQRIIDLMEAEGIDEGRLIIEGPATHRGLLEAYNRVDIALDPWPYSGGLTTCEAMLMGVPVVTLPGPTFAGRHSATHLVNTGMPELVTTSWDEYRERVLELASDLDSLSTIRSHLRDILLQSPVCDGPRFGRHLMMSLRAIWQRYCEGKAPAPLTFSKDGQAWFKGDTDPVQVMVAPPERDPLTDGFTWNLQGTVVAIDNSSKLLRNRSLELLLRTRAFTVVAFDPASLIGNPERYQDHEYVQLIPHALLGDGKPATLHACLDPNRSSVLEPLPSDHLPQQAGEASQVLARLPIATIALDSIEGLERVDWLLLDELSDASTILENGAKSLRDTLVIEARIALQPTHRRQASLDEISFWSSRNGFRFYHLAKMYHATQLPERKNIRKQQSSELMAVDALFIPSHERLTSLSREQKLRLAFILHTAYGIRDLTYRILELVDENLAEAYLVAEGIVESPAAKQDLRKVADKVIQASTPRQAKPTAGIDLPDAPYMSSDERQLFRRCLRSASRYFEFGSGGSTVWAVREGLTVQGVESDAQWVDALKSQLGDSCRVETVDIGPTGAWGFPVSRDSQASFPGYSLAIDAHDDPFDLILVDGRFRVACTMAAIRHVIRHFKDTDQARIFIHDFWNRPHYHCVLEFLDTIEKVDTAGVFKLKKDLNAEDIDSVWRKYANEPA